MMKKLSKIEIKNKIVKYLNNKGIAITLTENGNLIWNYEPHYSKFIIKVYVEEKSYGSEDYIIKYYSSNYPGGIDRRRTSITSGFCLKIYKNFLWLKENCDKTAEEVKTKVDAKNRYCTELEMYYKKLYDNVEINTNKQPDNVVDISVNCYSKGKSAYYLIRYKDNKYYLKNKCESFEENIPI